MPAGIVPVEDRRPLHALVARDWILIAFAASLLLHLAGVTGLALYKPKHGTSGPPEEMGVQMVFNQGVVSDTAVPLPGAGHAVPQGDSGMNFEPARLGIEQPEAPAAATRPDQDEASPLPEPPRPLPHPPAPRRSNPFAGLVFPHQTRGQSSAPAAGSPSAAPTTQRMGQFVTGGQVRSSETRLSINGLSGEYGDIAQRWLNDHSMYPESAGRNNESGDVLIRVTVARDGTVKNVQLLSSSYSRTLDVQTISVFKNKKMPAVPDDVAGMDADGDIVFTALTSYQLLYE